MAVPCPHHVATQIPVSEVLHGVTHFYKTTWSAYENRLGHRDQTDFPMHRNRQLGS